MDYQYIHRVNGSNGNCMHLDHNNTYACGTIVHAKLQMTSSNDAEEAEADSLADAVVRDGKIRRKISTGTNSGGISVSDVMEKQLTNNAGRGKTMPIGLKNIMEKRFGADFSQVRIHTDEHAAEMSESIHARAFTFGNDIYFNKGEFSPNSKDGQRLVAHEVAHVVQNSGKVARDEKVDENICSNEQVQDLNPSENENIVIVGAQYEKSNNKTMFISQGIGAIRRWKQEGFKNNTLVIFREGYDQLLVPVQQLVEKLNGNFVVVDSADELIKYINDGIKYPRSEMKIENIEIYSHGTNKAIEFGFHYLKAGSRYRLDFDRVKQISKDSFSNTANIYSYACRTGLPSTHGDGRNEFIFWCDDILAQQLADSTGTNVYAYARRTAYNHTLDENACEDKDCYRFAGDQIDWYDIDNGELSKDKFKIRYIYQETFPIMRSGALNIPTSGKTPANAVPNLMKFTPGTTIYLCDPEKEENTKLQLLQRQIISDNFRSKFI